MSLINRLREWRNARAEHTAAAEEMQFHIDRETQYNIERGMSAQAANRKAKQDFGGVDRFTEVARDERTGSRLSDFTASWLDWKLGGRMLIKYPGLSIIGGLTLAASMALGAGWFEFSWEMSNPDLPLRDGDRIVRLENWDAAANGIDPRAMHDFIAWREQLRSIADFGAYRNVERNLITPDGRALPEKVAEMTASGFAVPRVPPLHGRFLTDADAEPGAQDVVVIGYDLWHSRFNANPAVIGRTVQLGRVKATVVGVMPKDFLFPRSHQLWAPLRVTQTLPRSGPAINMFGRLADDVSLETAQAELDAIGARMAAANPATHAQLRPRVLAYAAPGQDLPPFIMINLLAWGVLAVAGTNVATLMFARTALRESEIVVRNALGASRLRVMGQLFAESLVLSLVSAVVGMIGFTLFARWMSSDGMSDVDEPFWWDITLGPETILYVCALAVFGAVIVGLLPALRATGPKVQAALRNLGGGGTHMQVGGLWTGLIVFQVALSVLGLPLALTATRETLSQIQVRSEFDATPYFTFRPALNRDEAPGGAADTTDAQLAARMATVLGELERRLESEPDVAAVTYSASIPGTYHPQVQLEVQRGTETPVIVDSNDEDDDEVYVSAVDIGFFDAFRLPLIAGRPFNNGDVNAANGVVIINEALAKNIGGNPVGARLRRVATSEADERSPWLEVVGVVRDLGLEPTANGESDFLFTPATVATLSSPRVSLRLNGDAAAFEPTLRAIATQVAPELRLYDVLPLEEVIRQDNADGLLAMFIAIGIIMLVLMLSAAGLFALMSVAVARRTREIGIRLAIGANPRAVLAALFRRAATQVGVGIVIGNILVVFVLSEIFEELDMTVIAGPMAVASLIMATVGVCACLVPARRALRVQPTEALKSAR